MAEYGVVVPVGLSKLRAAVPDILEDAENGLTTISRGFIDRLYQELAHWDEQVDELEIELHSLLKENDDYQRLQTIPGIGPVVAATLVAAVGDANYFKNGRQMAAWIGITPGHHASGDKTQYRGITKRGNRALRKMLIHGARAVLNWCGKKNDKLSLWLKALSLRAHPCKVVVALANKMARIAWAILATKQVYKAA